MGAGHVTVLQLCGPMGLRVLQWCHPMLACKRGQAIVPGPSPYMVHEKWIQARAFPSPS